MGEGFLNRSPFNIEYELINNKKYMKFIAKNANLRIVLQHGIAADPISGRAGVAGSYVKFQDGIVDVSDPKTIESMRTHSGFGSDYIEAPETGEDPYEATRKDSEPIHDMTELKFGTPVKRTSSPHKVNLTPEMKSVIESAAKEMALKMAPALAMEMLEKMAANAENKSDDSESEGEYEVEAPVEPKEELEAPVEEVVKPKAKSKVKPKK